jgi:hypothetical protein
MTDDNNNGSQEKAIEAMDRIDLLELQQNINGRGDKWAEIGTSGLRAYAGYITEAYQAKLQWPTCADEYNRMWRSDPEIGIARTVLQAFGAKLSLYFETPEGETAPTSDDQRAADFANQVLEDIEGGAGAWLISCLSRVLFYGWGWWETPPGLRNPDWRPPGGDPWRSNYDDGLIGFRRLAFRHYKSFMNWDLDEPSGRLRGMVQLDPYGHIGIIPLDKSLHIAFGDLENPEGLATMEAIWRLERVKYGLEVVFGIGAEHAAGHLSVQAERTLTDADNIAIKKAARMIMSAHEGNYAAWPSGIKGELVDVPFQAGTVLLDAIRYFGILKLGLLNMQWAALGTLSPYGSYSANADASTFFVSWFNAMTAGLVSQADQQIGKRLFDYPVNKAAFPGMTRRPVLKVTPAQKDIALAEMGQFLTAIQAIMPLGEDDFLAVRRKSEFLPEILPEVEDVIEPELEPKEPVEETPEEDADESVEGDGTPAQDADMAFRPLGVPITEQPVDVEPEAKVLKEDIDRAVRKFKKWAKENAPELGGLVDAEEEQPEEEPAANAG